MLLQPARAFAVACLLWLSAASAWAGSCTPNAVDLRWQDGAVRFSVEVADDFEERAQGLMFRETLGRFAGMIFYFEQPVVASFWMKNTLIPLDMIFIDETGVVRKIHENAIPGDLTGINSDTAVISVLEINGGLARKLGIPVGAQVRHPGLAQDTAIWACD